MMADPDRDIVPVEHGADIVRVHPLDIERKHADAPLAAGEEAFRLSPDARIVLAHLMQAGCCAFAALLTAFAGRLDEGRLRKAVLDLAQQGLLGLDSRGEI